MTTKSEATFFPSAAAFRKWLQKNHGSATELLVGFHKVGTGRPTMTWTESVDEALCFGWIDGVRKRIDDESYTIRFTPRKPSSNWSAINIAKVATLKKEGRMTAAGLAAFEKRREDKSAIYAYENEVRTLPPEYEDIFRANCAAWQWFNQQAPSYRRVAIYWVVNAKQEATRRRRLATLIADSAASRRLAQYTLEPRKTK
jgi:uncharacterized protein YdeI (YjbR/CyaY-like superfamily)